MIFTSFGYPHKYIYDDNTLKSYISYNWVYLNKIILVIMDCKFTFKTDYSFKFFYGLNYHRDNSFVTVINFYKYVEVDLTKSISILNTLHPVVLFRNTDLNRAAKVDFGNLECVMNGNNLEIYFRPLDYLTQTPGAWSCYGDRDSGNYYYSDYIYGKIVLMISYS